MTNDAFVIQDATKDERFSNNPLVIEQPAIRFYAGAPLTTRDGMNIGTLCAIDTVAREPTPEQISALEDLAKMVIDELDLRTAGRLAIEEVAMRKRLDDLKSAFVADVNHELRTPLTSIIGSLGLLSSGMMDELPEKPKELLTIADRNANQLLALINDLLDMSKLEAGAMEFDIESLDIVKLASHAVENTQNYAVEKHLTIEVITSLERLEVQADKRRLVQVMNNLLSNAIKFSPDHGRIDTRISKVDGYVRIEVTDQGPGIPPIQKAKIFEKFVQANASDKLGVKGTGLGLSISKSIVEAHGGAIGVESTEGRGSTFFFELPATLFLKYDD
jgi:signal transduction histidine kinase